MSNPAKVTHKPVLDTDDELVTVYNNVARFVAGIKPGGSGKIPRKRLVKMGAYREGWLTERSLVAPAPEPYRSPTGSGKLPPLNQVLATIRTAPDLETLSQLVENDDRPEVQKAAEARFEAIEKAARERTVATQGEPER